MNGLNEWNFCHYLEWAAGECDDYEEYEETPADVIGEYYKELQERGI